MRATATVRLVWGGLLVGVPHLVLGVLTGRPATTSQARVLRVLGSRHLLQGGIELARPTRNIIRAGAAVDLLHAATCAGAVAFLPAWRRAALVDGTGAVGFAAGGLARVRRLRFRGEGAVAGQGGVRSSRSGRV
jgi:hypothetical protein